MVLYVSKDYKDNYEAALAANAKINYVYSWLERKGRAVRQTVYNVSLRKSNSLNFRGTLRLSIRSSVYERGGTFDFDHHFAFLTIFLKRTFCLTSYFLARQGDHFQKKLFKTDLKFRSDFVKLSSKILYLFLAEKLSFVLFVLFCSFCFVAVLNTLSNFGLLFF